MILESQWLFNAIITMFKCDLLKHKPKTHIELCNVYGMVISFEGPIF